ncbi:ACRO protein, partial [Leptocoma aspasia]|nr:ACRO protein [Leptocoma aspasia]
WPGIASVQVTLENGTWHMCAGALVSHRWVLTAASCFIGAGNLLQWKVVIGATDLSQPGHEAQALQIKRILKHPHYEATTARNNIALLELDQPVECSDYIQLGCVPDSSLAVPELKTCYIAGWRATPDSGHLEPPAPEPSLPMGIQPGMQLWRGRDGKGRAQRWHSPDPSLLAQGDMGSPLVCKDNAGDFFWLVGVASWGRGCARARRPGIFTATQHFHSWIRRHAGPTPAA